MASSNQGQQDRNQQGQGQNQGQKGQNQQGGQGGQFGQREQSNPGGAGQQGRNEINPSQQQGGSRSGMREEEDRSTRRPGDTSAS